MDSPEKHDVFVHVRRTAAGFSQWGAAEATVVAGSVVGDAAPAVTAGWRWDGNTLRAQSDRYGVTNLYYFTKPDEICLSPSLTRLLAEGAAKDPDFEALAVFLRLSFFLGQSTPFREIRALPPQASLAWDGGHASVTEWWSPVAARKITTERAIDDYISLFRTAMQRRLPDDEFVLPLTGGRDSRHILFELVRAGCPPRSCVTVQPFPPQPDEDTRIAARLAEKLRIPLTQVGHPLSQVAAEMRKNLATDFCTDLHGWAPSLGDHLGRNTSLTYDGLAGDVLSESSFVTREQIGLLHRGDHRAVAQTILVRGSGQPADAEAALQFILAPDFYARVPRAGAIEHVESELRRHEAAANPLGSFYFWNRTRRAISLSPFRLLASGCRVHAPWLDEQLFDFLASLPAELVAERKLHSDAIRRAFPRWSDIPYGDKGAWWRTDPAHHRRLAADLHQLTDGVDQMLIRGPAVVGLLDHWVAKGWQGSIQWLRPPTYIYLLQLQQLLTANDEGRSVSDPTAATGSRARKGPLNDGEPKSPKLAWLKRRDETLAEIERVVPRDACLIIADSGAFVGETSDERLTLPFLEREGRYWGSPVDDAQAINELERMRLAGALYIAFTWTAFWWLDHYARFHSYLVANFQRVHQCNNVQIFHLAPR